MLLFTPGPTEVSPKVLEAMSAPILNPDLDEEFFSMYRSLCGKIKRVAGTQNDLLIMAGEGMLALDSAIANLVERRQNVLTISSGVFGDGFEQFVKNYGGVPVSVKADYNSIVSPNKIERELEKHRNIKVATFVHCETPSGTIAPIEEVGRICDTFGVILVADTVSTLGGTPVNGDENYVDVCLGASQKCFSAPPGLAIISLSPRTWEKIGKRKTKVASFYLDLSEWKHSWLDKGTFPYTQSVSDIFALNAALDSILSEGLDAGFQRHRAVARLVRQTCVDMGLELYPEKEEICSDTVTAIRVPQGVEEKALRDHMQQKYSVKIAGSWGKLSGKVLRLGHMGFNAHEDKARQALDALSKSLKDLGVKPQAK